MPVYRYPRIRASEITPEEVWESRRYWMKAAGATFAAGTLAGLPQLSSAANKAKLDAKRSTQFVLMEPLTPEKDATSYNNFFEFGMDKGDPVKYAHKMQTTPWKLRVEGECAAPKTFDLDDLLKLAPLEDRAYRMRCVEGWSMAIPWVGYSMSELIKQVQPNSNAKFVEFVTDMQPKNMPGLRTSSIDWPYRDGLRIDEAMHPLTMLVVGMYGKVLPNQNGAPVRMVVPWKYGFKSVKSIVTIRLLEKQPVGSWEQSQPSEYGFYSNVNPEVSHPRWSQATERRIGEDGLFTPKRKTLMLNGYANEVGSLYAGLDLRKNY
ncbi:MAG: protein-methionine-sulfoxide reductase catalytic subunit MsrP [Burkholderiaceae bacterium]|jgi:methionine sulfoxide reductase catalytic subunit|nr:protein-methionine-sulfoxide reductase catalytic subunit MsrP [Burkholderiaceae bacterium]MDP4969852.1 protein-methionine-sulfoxide reductase catalytic subunit MsrP [Burkholderiaceae bacterium]MDP5111889.1 protein-methionine-sulfoxide reductase catalytic subunit MsrP [Burkholderiaceae bacterium]